MIITYYLAKRYLVRFKSINAINLASVISMLGIFIGSAALIIILSVFNGFEKTILSMYQTFVPDIRIEPAHGKTFSSQHTILNHLKKDQRVLDFIEVLQEKALLCYGENRYIGNVKGVSNNYLQRRDMAGNLIHGAWKLNENQQEKAMVGSIAQIYLAVNVEDPWENLKVYLPATTFHNGSQGETFLVKTIQPSGVFQIQQQLDASILVPISFLRRFSSKENQVSSIEINLKSQELVKHFQKEISEKLGKGYKVKNRIQQNQLLYNVLVSEKWAVFTILSFVMIIATCNLLGSLTVLIMDKRKDIAILYSMGATKSLIQKVFFIEGAMIAAMGCFLGTLAGFIFCLLQQWFGFITMGKEALDAAPYPIDLHEKDFLLVFCTISLISLFISYIASTNVKATDIKKYL